MRPEPRPERGFSFVHAQALIAAAAAWLLAGLFVRSLSFSVFAVSLPKKWQS
jgi:hypothetical protein